MPELEGFRLDAKTLKQVFACIDSEIKYNKSPVPALFWRILFDGLPSLNFWDETAGRWNMPSEILQNFPKIAFGTMLKVENESELLVSLGVCGRQFCEDHKENWATFFGELIKELLEPNLQYCVWWHLVSLDTLVSLMLAERVPVNSAVPFNVEELGRYVDLYIAVLQSPYPAQEHLDHVLERLGKRIECVSAYDCIGLMHYLSETKTPVSDVLSEVVLGRLGEVIREDTTLLGRVVICSSLLETGLPSARDFVESVLGAMSERECLEVLACLLEKGTLTTRGSVERVRKKMPICEDEYIRFIRNFEPGAEKRCWLVKRRGGKEEFQFCTVPRRVSDKKNVGVLGSQSVPISVNREKTPPVEEATPSGVPITFTLVEEATPSGVPITFTLLSGEHDDGVANVSALPRAKSAPCGFTFTEREEVAGDDSTDEVAVGPKRRRS